MIEYSVKFILPDNDFKNVRIECSEFPENLNTEMEYCKRSRCFSTTLLLPQGKYHYHFNADGNIVYDILRAPQGGDALLCLGTVHNNGIHFDIDKIFIRNNHMIITLGYDIHTWISANLIIQDLHNIQTIKGKHLFFEGSYNYETFSIPLSKEEPILAYFEIENDEQINYLGVEGLKDKEWSITPFEFTAKEFEVIHDQGVVSIYNLAHSKAIKEFEKHDSYLDRFTPSYLIGDIHKDSPLLKESQPLPKHFQTHRPLSHLLRHIFLDTEEVGAGMGLLGRFFYEIKQNIANLRVAISDEDIAFWDLVHRHFSVAKRGIGFQLFCTMSPEIYFGEEIGLVKTGEQRNMYWTKTKWNKDLFNYYQKLLKIRKKYPVLQSGGIRFIMQDCGLWGVERYMDGEDSIFIFANHTKDNIVIDLTQIMNYSGPIIELLSDHPIKRKKVCTIFGESFVAFKANSSKQEEDDESSKAPSKGINFDLLNA